MFETLCRIAEAFNKENLTWAVGASIMLHHYGLVVQPRDIDLLVTVEDVDKAGKILDQMGHLCPPSPKGTYATTYFLEYDVEGTDIDLMADMRIKHGDETFVYGFDHNSITDHMSLNSVPVPLTSLEDWYVIYQMIPGREKKVNLIKQYLTDHGIQHSHILNAYLETSLPEEVKQSILALLHKKSDFTTL